MASILIADDDPDMLALTKFKLEQSGYRVITASDGREALEQARIEAPDVAVLDVMMPHVDGLAVCHELSSCTAQPMRILLLSARGREADVEAGFRAGADDYVIKPFSPRELMTRIEALLAR
ncbi:MAG: response regulator transcription factor [Acidimicrobiia bacterium]|nr:response regulator transcription factor [Acidimicrobiia bacterium]